MTSNAAETSTKASPTLVGDTKEEDDDLLLRYHLDWSARQGRILTGGGLAEKLYTAERGFAFEECELPHYHLAKGATQDIFKQWLETAGAKSEPHMPVVGCWDRPLFCGGWEHSTNHDEYAFNIQTNNLFIDLRIPKSRNGLLALDGVKSIDDLTPRQLRIFARQHIFCGFTKLQVEKGGRSNCTRHHCIDWNYVDKPRTRPNKWWIDVHQSGNIWKELAYATDDDNQHYYMERWERRELGTPTPRLALRVSSEYGRDGIFVLCGDHFNYAFNRTVGNIDEAAAAKYSNLVELVDGCVEAGDLQMARAFAGIDGGHGRVSNGWKIDHAIQPWSEGKPLWTEGDVEVISREDGSFHLLWRDQVWEVYDSTFESGDAFSSFLANNF